MTGSVSSSGIHYSIEGGGPWVVLSHSLACDLSMWDPQVPALLEAGYRVLRYDMRGHGASLVTPPPYTLDLLLEDLIALLDELGVERAHVVGLSIGGMIAQRLALEHPKRLHALVLCDTTARSDPSSRPVWEDRFGLARDRGMQALVEPTLSRWFTAPFRAAHPEVMERIGALIRRTPVDGYEGCARALLELDHLERLKEIDLPALVIVGEDDPGTPVPAAREIHDRIRGSELAVLHDASHLSSVEQSARFNEVLIEFLRRKDG
jgi:3-oxoadipate enol-lactonase